MPVVTVKIVKGRDAAKKRALVAAVTEAPSGQPRLSGNLAGGILERNEGIFFRSVAEATLEKYSKVAAQKSPARREARFWPASSARFACVAPRLRRAPCFSNPAQTRASRLPDNLGCPLRTIDAKPEWVTVIIDEYPRENWASDGKLHSDKYGRGCGKQGAPGKKAERKKRAAHA